MDLEQLRQFALVARHASVTRAAEELHMSQPALSRSVARLERDLGARLLERSPNRVALSAAGEVALGYAEEILASESRMRSALDTVAHLRESVRVETCTPSALWTLTPMLVSRAASARIASDVVEEALALRDLAAGRCDLAIVASEPHVPGVLSTPLMEERLYLSAPSGHPLARRESVRLSELDGEAFLVFGGIGWWWGVLDRNLPHSHIERQDDREVFRGQLAATDRLAFASDAGVNVRFNEQVGSAGSRALVPIEGEDARATFWLARRADATGIARGVFDEVRATARA